MSLDNFLCLPQCHPLSLPAALVVNIVVVVARVDVIVREAKERRLVLQTERERESERESARGTDRQRVGERERE